MNYRIEYIDLNNERKFIDVMDSDSEEEAKEEIEPEVIQFIDVREL